MQNAAEIIKNHPLFGTGLGQYLYAQSQLQQNFPDLLNQPVHNIFLLLSSEAGLVIISLLWFLFFNQIKAFATKYLFIFLAILVTGFFDHYWLTLQQNFLLLGVVGGVLFSSANDQKVSNI